jgi:hypothetical protein
LLRYSHYFIFSKLAEKFIGFIGVLLFLIPGKRYLEQLSGIGSDFLVFVGLIYHVHLAEFGVCKKDGDAEFAINELDFGVSR